MLPTPSLPPRCCSLWAAMRLTRARRCTFDMSASPFDRACHVDTDTTRWAVSSGLRSHQGATHITCGRDGFAHICQCTDETGLRPRSRIWGCPSHGACQPRLSRLTKCSLRNSSQRGEGPCRKSRADWQASYACTTPYRPFTRGRHTHDQQETAHAYQDSFSFSFSGLRRPTLERFHIHTYLKH